MKKAEYQENLSCPQRDSAEHEGYVGAQSVGGQEGKEQDGADLLERILSRGNLNNAYKRVRANKGAPGIDGMTVEDALPWLREHREELLDMIRQGKYKPQPVRRKEIPKPDGGVRKLGIPTVVDRIIQQAIAQQLTPIYEPLFSDLSYGYRPGRSAQDAILKVKEYAEKGYTQAVLVDLSKYFDTLNHELLMNLLRKNIHDKRVIELIKRYLKAGVMENGLLEKTEEGSPQRAFPLRLLFGHDHSLPCASKPFGNYLPPMPATLESPIESGSLPSFSASSTVSKCNIGIDGAAIHPIPALLSLCSLSRSNQANPVYRCLLSP